MLKINKKALGLQWYALSIAFIFGLATFFVFHISTAPKTETNYIGEIQLYLIKATQRADKMLFYIEQSAKYASYKAINDLAKKGGYYNTPCGTYFGYSIWVNKETVDGKEQIKYCNPTDDVLKANINLIFNKYMNPYILAYQSAIPTDNYKIIVAKSSGTTDIVGKAIHSVNFGIGIYEEALESKELIESNLVEFSNTELCAKGEICKLTLEAYEKLKEAQEIAKKEKLSLEVYSSYRTIREQEDLWFGRTPERYAERYLQENIRSIYVCNPTTDAYRNCPHLTGNAVDIRFKGKGSNENMKDSDWDKLANIMYKADWVRYENEKWHFEYVGNIPLVYE